MLVEQTNFKACCDILRAAQLKRTLGPHHLQGMKKRPYTQFLSPRYWPTWLGFLLLRILVFLPLPVLALLGQGIGLMFYYLGSARRKIAERNITACFPEKSLKECQRINRAHFKYAGQMVLTLPLNWWSSDKRFNGWISQRNREIYDKALQGDKNIILLAPHFVALEVAGVYLSQERPMASMYQYSKNTLVDEVVRQGRLRFGGELVERKGPLRKLLRLINSGYPFIYLPDQDAGRKGVFVPFFHELASTIPMLANFARFTDSVVIPIRTEIKPWGRGYEIVFNEPMENFPVGDQILDTTSMNQVIEKMVRENPEQYFWAHKRFKTRPKGEAKFYN